MTLYFGRTLIWSTKCPHSAEFLLIFRSILSWIWARKTSFKYWMESNYHMTYGCMYFGLCYRNAAQTNSRILFLYFQSEMDELSIHICIMFIQNILKFILNFENNLHSHTQRTQADDWVSDVMVNEYSCMEYSCWFSLIKKNWPLKCLFTK